MKHKIAAYAFCILMTLLVWGISAKLGIDPTSVFVYYLFMERVVEKCNED